MIEKLVQQAAEQQLAGAARLICPFERLSTKLDTTSCRRSDPVAFQITTSFDLRQGVVREGCCHQSFEKADTRVCGGPNSADRRVGPAGLPLFTCRKIGSWSEARSTISSRRR